MVKKIEKITIDLNKIDRDLKHKSQELNSIFVDEYFNKKPVVLEESAWITATPESYEYSLSQGALLPLYVDFVQDFDLTIPENYLPFIDIQLITKTPADIELAGVVPFNHLSFLGDVIEIWGNGSTLIYKGGFPKIGQIFQLIGLENGINPDHAIKIWVGETHFMDGVLEYKMWGHVPSLLHPDASSHVYVVTDTYNSPAILYKKIGGVWVSQGYQTRWFFPPGTGIISETYVENGYWCVYEPWSFRENLATVYAFNETPLVADGIFYKMILASFPGYGYDPGIPPAPDPRYWDTVVLKRNPDVYEPFSESTIMAGNRQQSLFKVFKSTDTIKEKYRLNVKGKIVFKGNAITPSTLDIPKYNDVYTKEVYNPLDNTRTYYRSSYNHTLTGIPRYAPLTPNIEYKIKVVLTNPHDYANRSDYKK